MFAVMSVLPALRIYKRRKETVERTFADAKQLHGHHHARMRGLAIDREPYPHAAVRWRGNFNSFPCESECDASASVLILVFADVFHPIDDLPANLLLDGGVCHAFVGVACQCFSPG